MPRPQNLKRDARIIELRAQGLSMRQIGEELGVSAATVHRALQPVGTPEQLLAFVVQKLESRIEVLEKQAVISEEFMQLIARVSAHWGFTYRDQIMAIIHRWPKPSPTSLPTSGNSTSPKRF